METVFNPKHNRGEDHGRSKLKEVDVIAIRQSNCSCRLLAMRYEVSAMTISRIKNLETWRHV